MTIPRAALVDSELALCYHLVSRCVRQAHLCGSHAGQSYSHRQRWIEQRLLLLAECFAVDLLAFAILSNHFHLIVYFDPKAFLRWSDAEVARRWLRAFPVPAPLQSAALEQLLSDPERLQRCRERLGSLSAFMQHLKQPIAVFINREDEAKGHLFEQRFYSGALLDERAVLAAMRYVDLNPFRAKIAQSLQHAEHTSIQRRLKALAASPERLEHYLAPLTRSCAPMATDDASAGASAAEPPAVETHVQDDIGVDDAAAHEPAAQQHHPAMPRITLRAYIALLEETMRFEQGAAASADEKAKAQRWQQAAAQLHKCQRAYGEHEALTRWLDSRRFRHLEKAL